MIAADNPGFEKFEEAGHNNFDALFHQPLGNMVVGKCVVLDVDLTDNADARMMSRVGFDGVELPHRKVQPFKQAGLRNRDGPIHEPVQVFISDRLCSALMFLTDDRRVIHI